MTLIIQPFSIEMPSVTPENRGFCESIFSQGNGYMGVRGYDPLGQKTDDHTRSVFLAGCFEYIKSGITDMVNTPDFFSVRMPENAKEINASLSLNMKTGMWERRAQWEIDGTPVQITTRRIVSMAQKHLAAMQIRVQAPERLRLSMLCGIDGGVANLPVSDDQMIKNTQEHRLLLGVSSFSDERGGCLCMKTASTGRRLHEAYSLVHQGVAQGTAGAYTRVEGCGSFLLEQFAAVYSWHDGAENDPGHAVALCREYAAKGFDHAARESAEAWEKCWEACDIQLDADDALQGAVRYNIFQLLQNNAADDPHASIGARGLMHGRYKGNYFWDTELFMLPFYQYTRPEAAKNLLMYRWHTLPDAIEGAKGFGVKGARYPWMCSDTGFEQCETWDTGCCEIHITADIAHAVQDYCDMTGDTAFRQGEGAEILLYTARYWQSRLTYCANDGQWHLLFVKGPDEYCGVTHDNTYTNYLVRENLKNAASIGEELLRRDARRMADLGFSAEEFKTWRETAEKIPLLYDEKRDLYLEDALFEMLEPLDIAACKQGDAALYRTMSYDRLQRYQVCKQADLVLLMTLFPDAFTQEQQRNVYDYYEPKTLHDSTLSFGTHAHLAAKLGRREDAWRYFEKSVFLDLKDVMENTAGEGIHMAALGATWQALVFGFMGMKATDGSITLKPSLPEEIRGIHTVVTVSGRRYRLDATHQSATVKPL